jgi:hypothetical protein
MSLSPLASALTQTLGTVTRPQEQRGRVDGGYTRPAPATPAATSLRPQTPLAGGQQSLPVEAPPGTDPELWSVLTADERSFFAKASALGPLTYGRVKGNATAPQAPAARGGRLDVRG